MLTGVAVSFILFGFFASMYVVTHNNITWIDGGFSLLFVLGAVLLMLKDRFIVWFMKKSAYPGIVYSVVDKMSLYNRTVSYIDDRILDDLHQPEYDTQTFLKRNDLSSTVYMRGNEWIDNYPIALFAIGGVVALLLNAKGVPFSLWWTFPIFILIILINLAIRYNKPTFHNGVVQYTFMPEYLQSEEGKRMYWKHIKDWTYFKQDRYDPERVYLHYTTNDTDGHEDILINITQLSESGEGFLMLLAHYKYKYGSSYDNK